MEQQATYLPELAECDIRLTDTSIVIDAPSHEIANLLKCRTQWTAGWALRRRKLETLITYPNCSKPYCIPARMAMQNRDMHYTGNISMDTIVNLLGADYAKIHEFLMQQRTEGNIVIVTSNITRDAKGNPINTSNPKAGRDICHHTNDQLLPSRAVWSPHQFTGYNYRLSWRASRNDYKRLNPQYDRLRELLQRDGQVLDYEYELFRPDGAHCSYSTSYFLCRNYLGDEVRIGVSRPFDFRVLKLA